MAKIFDVVSSDYTTINAVAGGALAAGQYVALNEVLGFPLTDVVSGDNYQLVIKAKLVKAVKLAGVTFVAGEKLYYVAGTTNVTNVASTLPCIGVAEEASASASTECLMVFDGTEYFLEARIYALENA